MLLDRRPRKHDSVTSLPRVFNGIVSGDLAMCIGLSNLAIGKWIPVAYKQGAARDDPGKPEIEKFLTDRDRVCSPTHC